MTTNGRERTNRYDDLSSESIRVNGCTYRKDERHWYEEGNVVFLLSGKAFRLHGSVVSRRSSVLSQAIKQADLPASDGPSSQTDRGVKYYITLEDNSKDFAHVLDFIYPDTLPGAKTEHLTVYDVMGMVRLGQRYKIQDLLKWAIAKLGKDFLLLPSHKSARKALEDTKRYGNAMFSVKVIQFARECALPQYLPFAFYSLATKDWSTDAHDATCIQMLASADQKKLLEARVTLTKMVLSKAFSMAENGGLLIKCASWSCTYITPAVWTPTTPESRWECLLLRPIEELEYRIAMSYPKLCQECRTKIVERSGTLRNELIGVMA